MIHRPQKYDRKDRWPNVPWQSDVPDKMSGWEWAAWCFVIGITAGFVFFGPGPW
jgi:hypothetical protein